MNYIQQHNQVQEWHNLLSGYVLPGIVYAIDVNMLPDTPPLDEFINAWMIHGKTLIYSGSLDNPVIKPLYK